MLRRMQFNHREQPRRAGRSHVTLSDAGAAVCEALEARQLLTAFTFNVPQNDGYTSVYLRPGAQDGWVNVRKNSETGTIVHTFTGDNNNGTGMYIVDAGSLSGFLFVDQVSAANKPTATQAAPNDHGIKVQGGTSSTLRVEAQSTDQYMTVTQSTSTSNTIEVTDITVNPIRTGTSRTGSGVTNLTLRSYDFPVPGNPPTPATSYYPTLATSGGGTDVVVKDLAEDIFLTVDTGAARYNRVWLGTNEIFDDGHLFEEANVITGAGRCQVFVRGDDTSETHARIDFGPRSSTGHNRLELKLNSVATLAQLAGSSHVIVVEEVNMDSGYAAKPARLYVEDPSEIDDLDEISWAHTCVEATADGTEVGTFLVNPSCTAFIQGESTIDAFTIEGQVEFYDTAAPSVVDHFEVGASSVTGSSGVVTLVDGADVTALATSRIGTLNIGEDAVFTLDERTGLPSHTSGAHVLWVKSLSIEKAPTLPQGVLDLTDNAMIIDYSGSSPLTDVEDYITFAYANAAWTADGIGSSTAADVAGTSAPKTGLGYGEATDLFSSFPATWEGQTSAVDNTSVLVKYTYYGDANLNGFVNLQDFNRLASNFGGTNKRWTHGDFNYDNNVNLQDFNRLAANFGVGAVGSEYDDYTEQQLQEMLPD